MSFMQLKPLTLEHMAINLYKTNTRSWKYRKLEIVYLVDVENLWKWILAYSLSVIQGGQSILN